MVLEYGLEELCEVCLCVRFWFVFFVFYGFSLYFVLYIFWFGEEYGLI